MANADIRFGSTNGPDLYLCDSDSSETKTLGLNDAGDIILDGARIGDGWVPLLSQVASASATIEFSSTYITSTYDTYPLVMEYVRPASAGVDMWLRVSTDGGSTWKTGASDYEYSAWGAQSNSIGPVDNRDTGAAQIVVTADNITNIADQTLSATLYLRSPAIAATRTGVGGILDYVADLGTDRVEHANLGGSYIAAAAVNGLQILMSSGNITSGRFTLYGLKHQ